MSIAQLANRYAKALFDLAEKSGKTNNVESDLGSILNTAQSSSLLLSFVKNPTFSKSTKESVMVAISKRTNADKLTVNFIRLLARNGRLDKLPEIINSYISLMMNSRGEEFAHITTASPLKDFELRNIEESLSKSIKKKVIAQVSVNDSILGGVVVRMGSVMLDASLSGKLEKLTVLSKKAVANLN